MIIKEDTTPAHIIDLDEEEDPTVLAHYGTRFFSGRYPWGSGNDPYQRSKGFMQYVDELRKEGWKDVDIAKAFSTDDIKFTTTDLRNMRTLHGARIEAAERDQIRRMKEDKQMSTMAIARQLDIPEATVRSRLKPIEETKHAILLNTAEALRQNMAQTGGFLDVSHGTANHLGVSPEKLATAITMLEDEGYQLMLIKSPQLGTGKETTTKVLVPKGTEYPDLIKNQDKIHTIASYSEDGGRSYITVEPPVAVKPSRVAVRYKEDGGATKDGVIELRRGVKDLDLGQARYAQVRVKVGDGHYLKGMAMYSDDLPEGVDILFNTNKSDTGNKLDAMKSTKRDKETGLETALPFGSIVRQKHYPDGSGKQKLSALNIVGTTKTDDDGNDISYAGEEGGWNKWSKTLSSQMLSKQSPELARRQLALALERKQNEFNAIQALTNPTVKKKLLDAFADGADSAANHLKAVGLPRTANHVLLPIGSLKDNEIYAPNYENGETVVLIRHPHGGTFEIPELTVNNRNKEANRLIHNAKDAVGINSNVAARLSGADFDGDTVLVIPNPPGATHRVKSTAPLAGLKNFDPQSAYPPYDGMKTIDGGTWNAKTKKVDYPIDPKTGKPRSPNKQNKQLEMGKVSNLITDMSLLGASDSEKARAVRHSMVVIDAEKHSLDYRTSAKANGIAALKTLYQGGPTKGAATLISRAKSEERIDARKPRPAAEGGNIDPDTGEQMWVKDDRKKYVNAQGEEVYRQEKVTRMSLASDARELISKNGGTQREHIYADHANGLKSLANQARKASAETPSLQRNSSAAQAYAAQVTSLDAKLDLAQRNAPLERSAQRLAKTMVDAKVAANPDLDKDGIRKVNAQAIEEARNRVGAEKPSLKISPIEWQAIQAGAITNNKLKSILDAADLDQVKELATPRADNGIPQAKLNRAQALLNRGYSYAEVSEMLGISTTTLHTQLG